jgi:hypothetical protein
VNESLISRGLNPARWFARVTTPANSFGPQRRISLALRPGVVALMIFLIGACSSAPDSSGNVPCPASTPVNDLSLMPRDLQLQDYATITRIGKNKGVLGVSSTSDEKIVELFPRLSRALIDGGYRIRAADNEGFEAEIYFTRGPTLGSFIMREGPCDGQITVRLLYMHEPYKQKP